MNFNLPHIPERTQQPRKNGITMMMDKGLSLNEAENFIQASGHLTDIVKFGFGTAYVTNNLEEKLKLYRLYLHLHQFIKFIFECRVWVIYP